MVTKPKINLAKAKNKLVGRRYEKDPATGKLVLSKNPNAPYDETDYLLSDPETAAQLQEAKADIASGRVKPFKQIEVE